jgi:hypothetical protein
MPLKQRAAALDTRISANEFEILLRRASESLKARGPRLVKKVQPIRKTSAPAA